MRRFIFNSLKQMLNSTYLCLIFIYALFCWIISEAGFTQKGFLSSGEILGYYSMVFLSLVAVNSIYFIISHFRETLNNSARDVLILRLGKYKYFWGLIVCYFIFLIVFNLLPLILAAFLQDVIYNGIQHINTSIYFISLFKIISWIGLWPIVLSVVLITWIKNDLLTLISWSVIYLLISGINLISQQYITGDGTMPLSVLPAILNIILSIMVLFIAIHISKKITLYEYNEKISGGIFSFMAGVVGLDLTRYHYKMIGFKTQILYLIFGSSGFIIIFAIFNGMHADNLIISKMFIAVIFPLLFSFNQYSLISIDLESGMIISNVLKKISYDKIVLNRWFSMLIPQVLFLVVFSLLLMNMISGISLSFIILAVALNLLFSSMNLSMAVYFNRSGYANFIVGFLAYIMLREDIQNLITSNKILNHINIFKSITSFSNHIPEPSHIAICICISFVFFTLAEKRLRIIQKTLYN